MLGQVLTHLRVYDGIAGLAGIRAVLITVVYAQGRSDQNDVMDFDICCAQAARVRHIFCCNMLASALRLVCDDKQDFSFADMAAYSTAALTRRTSPHLHLDVLWQCRRGPTGSSDSRSNRTRRSRSRARGCWVQLLLTGQCTHPP